MTTYPASDGAAVGLSGFGESHAETHHPHTADEIANALTHGLGLVLSLTGLITLVALSVFYGDVWQIVGCTVFGVALVTLYLASTLYHTIRNVRAKRVLRIVDHICIYLLIAGTYTPFTLVNLRGPWGWSLFGVVWTIALVGIFCKLRFGHGGEWLSMAAYIAMGWVCIVGVKPILATLPTAAIFWLVAGGISYTAGTIFYARDHIRFFHAVWHLFVLAGSVFHFVAVALSMNLAA